MKLLFQPLKGKAISADLRATLGQGNTIVFQPLKGKAISADLVPPPQVQDVACVSTPQRKSHLCGRVAFDETIDAPAGFQPLKGKAISADYVTQVELLLLNSFQPLKGKAISADGHQK